MEPCHFLLTADCGWFFADSWIANLRRTAGALETYCWSYLGDRCLTKFRVTGVGTAGLQAAANLRRTAVRLKLTAGSRVFGLLKKWNLREGFGDNRAIQKVANVVSRIPITFCMAT